MTAKTSRVPLGPVFISYARPDRVLAENLYKTLAESGADPWMDCHDIPLGEPWDFCIQQALDACCMILLIHTENSAKSKNVWDEWSYCLSQDKPVLPLVFETYRFPFRLARVQYLDFTIIPYNQAIKELLRYVPHTEEDPTPDGARSVPKRRTADSPARSPVRQAVTARPKNTESSYLNTEDLEILRLDRRQLIKPPEPAAEDFLNRHRNQPRTSDSAPGIFLFPGGTLDAQLDIDTSENDRNSELANPNLDHYPTTWIRNANASNDAASDIAENRLEHSKLALVHQDIGDVTEVETIDIDVEHFATNVSPDISKRYDIGEPGTGSSILEDIRVIVDRALSKAEEDDTDCSVYDHNHIPNMHPGPFFYQLSPQ